MDNKANKIKEKLIKYKPVNEQEKKDRELMLKYIETFDDTLTRDNTLCHFTASSWIINKEKTKAIMIYHNIYDSWAWTGGHCDGDGDLLKVALKEAKEETGLTNIKYITDEIASVEILTVDSHIKRGKFVSSHLHMNCSFIFEADENEELKIKADENSNIQWFSLEETINKTTEEKMKSIYEKLNNQVMKLI